MVLNNLCIAQDPSEQLKSIRLSRGSIQSVSNAIQNEGIDMAGAIAFPGFINSHDHLDFNLFPLLGNRIYTNYTQWGKDIHITNKAAINRILRIPTAIRTRWGLYKNLVNGFTTVVNHGKKLVIDEPFLSVYQESCSLHSPSFEKYWQVKLNNPFMQQKLVSMHIGEGTDLLAHEEIDRLIQWNLLSKKIVAIHGVAMDTEQAKQFAALVWCPASNHFLLGDTAPIQELKKNTRILFGSDATLTAAWNIWQHLDPIIYEKNLSAEELLSALTSTPASVWELPDRGTISEGKIADIVITTDRRNLGNHFITGPDDILLVIKNGIVRLFDESLHPVLSSHFIHNQSFTKIRTGKYCKYIFGNITKLSEDTKRYCPDISLPLSIEA